MLTVKDEKILITQLPSLARAAMAFSLAVQNRKLVILSGGYEYNMIQPMKRVTILDTVKHHETDLLDLNQARLLHSSIVLAESLFVFGGMINSTEFTGTIECLSLLSM